jgi:hypothetical protein
MLNRTKSTLLSLTTLAALGLAATQPAHAQITGFGTGSGFTLNHGTSDPGDGGDPATISNGTLTITDNTSSQGNSAIDNTKQTITAFTSSFTYQALAGTNYANGMTFVIENAPLGASAVGSRGDGLGWGNNDSGGRNIPTSAAVEFNIYNGYQVGTNFATAGATGAPAGGIGMSDTYNPTGNVNLTSSDPILVVLSYDGTTLSETLTDTTTLASYNTSYTTNLASVVGGNTAYVGFTGGDGGYNGVQTISNFTFAAAPEPSQYAGLGLGVLGVAGLAFKARKRQTAA